MLKVDQKVPPGIVLVQGIITHRETGNPIYIFRKQGQKSPQKLISLNSLKIQLPHLFKTREE